MIDIGIPPHLLAGSLIGTMAQRLARVLCPKCKKKERANIEESKILGITGEPPEIYRSVGCEVCLGTGYKGRIAISEILPVDRELDELISMGATRKTIMEHALANGLVPMIDDGVAKVLDGLIDVKELIRVVDVTSRFS